MVRHPNFEGLTSFDRDVLDLAHIDMRLFRHVLSLDWANGLAGFAFAGIVDGSNAELVLVTLGQTRYCELGVGYRRLVDWLEVSVTWTLLLDNVTLDGRATSVDGLVPRQRDGVFGGTVDLGSVGCVGPGCVLSDGKLTCLTRFTYGVKIKPILYSSSCTKGCKVFY